jgi:hypothetical protein
MFKVLAGSRAAASVSAAVVASLAVWGGWALAASGSGSLHGCADTKTGALRLAAHCRRHERSVLWNVRGAPGPPGLAGAAGPAGATGPAGPPGFSSATEVFRDLGPTFSAQNASTLVAQLTNLPAGAYLLSARVGLFVPSGGSAGVIDCFLSGGSAPVDATKAALGVVNPGENGLAALPLEMTTTYAASGGTAQVSCLKEDNNATVVEAGGTKLIAVRVGSETRAPAS